MARTNNLTNFLNDVSSAIKQKTGDNTPIPASEFDTEILNIETKGEYQQKTVNIESNGTQIFTPEAGYDAIDQLTVITNVPMQSLQSKSVQITSNGNISVLPDTGYQGMTQVDLTVNVPVGTDTSDATATANDIAENKTAYVNGVKITGTASMGDPTNLDGFIQAMPDSVLLTHFNGYTYKNYNSVPDIGKIFSIIGFKEFTLTHNNLKYNNDDLVWQYDNPDPETWEPAIFRSYKNDLDLAQVISVKKAILQDTSDSTYTTMSSFIFAVFKSNSAGGIQDDWNDWKDSGDDVSSDLIFADEDGLNQATFITTDITYPNDGSYYQCNPLVYKAFTYNGENYEVLMYVSNGGYDKDIDYRYTDAGLEVKTMRELEPEPEPEPEEVE